MSEKKKWRALDHCSTDKKTEPNTQIGDQLAFTTQRSKELIVIRDSEDITVKTTDTQAAISLQLGIQAAITAVLSISIGDSDRASRVAQEIFQFTKTNQVNKQKLIIIDSKKVNVTTTDTDISINIQVLLQILVALVVRLDVF